MQKDKETELACTAASEWLACNGYPKPPIRRKLRMFCPKNLLAAFLLSVIAVILWLVFSHEWQEYHDVSVTEHETQWQNTQNRMTRETGELLVSPDPKKTLDDQERRREHREALQGMRNRN